LADRVPARTIRAVVEVRRADIAAGAAVARVRQGVDAHSVASDVRQWALDTLPLAAIRGRPAADVATRSAVIGVAFQIDARVPAQHQPRLARAGHALRAVRRSLGARVAASAAVIGVPLQQRARSTAADIRGSSIPDRPLGGPSNVKKDSPRRLAYAARTGFPTAADNAAATAVERVKVRVGANAAAVRAAAYARANAPAKHACSLRRANDTARPAVVWVRQKIDALPVADGAICAGNARSLVAVRRQFAAHVAAGAAVIGIRIDEGAQAVAVHGAAGAAIHALASHARVPPIGSRFLAHVTAGAAVFQVVIQEGASPAAVDGSLEAGVLAPARDAGTLFVATRLLADISAGAAVVEVAVQIGTDVAAGARSTKTAGVAVARAAGSQTLILLPFVATSAEAFAWVGAGGRDGFQPQRAEEDTGQGCS